MQRSSINCNKPTIQEIFTFKKYKIPKYQRAFAWNKDNAEKFWTDIFESGNEDDYFLWSVLFSSSWDNVFEVIDWQQRLTTCSLFFFSLYLVYRDNIDVNLAERFIYPFLKIWDINWEYNLLTLSRNNNSFYQEVINTSSISSFLLLNPSEESNKQMKDIIKFFIEQINKNRSNDRDTERTRLNKIFERFKKNVFLLEVIVPDSGQASKLFEVLNNRWSDLTEADLIRNYLLSELENKGFYTDDMVKKWEIVEDNIELDNLEKFLRYSSFLVSEKWELYDRIMEFNLSTSPKHVIDYFNRLSNTYSKLLFPEQESVDEEESRLLSELKLLEVSQARSVLLAAYEKYNLEDVKRLIDFLISFTVRYSILWKNPNKLEKTYANISYDIFNSWKNLSGVKDELLKYVNNDEEFKIAFISHEFKTTKLPRYILSKIENYISTWEKKVALDSVHLEHIMPKKADKWIEADPSIIETHKNYLNTIWNMIILHDTINIRIKNNIFDLKKQHYIGSEVLLLWEIKECQKWSKEEIEWNANRYLSHFNQIWSL